MRPAESQSVHVIRHLPASPERVFEAWINPALLRCWLAPIAEADARAGGYYRLEVAKPEGVHVVSGEYREFVRGERLVMTWIYEGSMAPAGKLESLVTVDFRREGLSTEIKVSHDGLASSEYLETIRCGAWSEALDKLEAVLAER